MMNNPKWPAVEKPVGAGQSRNNVWPQVGPDAPSPRKSRDSAETATLSRSVNPLENQEFGKSRPQLP